MSFSKLWFSRSILYSIASATNRDKLTVSSSKFEEVKFLGSAISYNSWTSINYNQTYPNSSTTITDTLFLHVDVSSSSLINVTNSDLTITDCGFYQISVQSDSSYIIHSERNTATIYYLTVSESFFFAIRSTTERASFIGIIIGNDGSILQYNHNRIERVESPDLQSTGSISIKSVYDESVTNYYSHSNMSLTTNDMTAGLFIALPSSAGMNFTYNNFRDNQNGVGTIYIYSTTSLGSHTNFLVNYQNSVNESSSSRAPYKAISILLYLSSVSFHINISHSTFLPQYDSSVSSIRFYSNNTNGYLNLDSCVFSQNQTSAIQDVTNLDPKLTTFGQGASATPIAFTQGEIITLDLEQTNQFTASDTYTPTRSMNNKEGSNTSTSITAGLIASILGILSVFYFLFLCYFRRDASINYKLVGSLELADRERAKLTKNGEFVDEIRNEYSEEYSPEPVRKKSKKGKAQKKRRPSYSDYSDEKPNRNSRKRRQSYSDYSDAKVQKKRRQSYSEYSV